MAAPEVDLGVRLLVYGALAVAIPLSFVLLFRVVDRLSLDGYVEQYEDAMPEAGHGFDAPPAVVHDEGVCHRCGEENDPGFTFCRSCQARIGG